MDLRKIRTLLQLMEENGLAEMELEEEGFKIKFSKNTTDYFQNMPLPVMEPSRKALGAMDSAMKMAGEGQEEGEWVTSPMPGTFYVSPSPEKPPFVQVGDQINEESVVCIIEAMKVMNEIKAECAGRIVEVLVSNGEPVEFGKPLFRVV
jgi:acetyl-CoA carboxylase biotin carboxyl carrier protein